MDIVEYKNVKRWRRGQWRQWWGQKLWRWDGNGVGGWATASSRL